MFNKARKVKIIERKLGQHQAWGLWHENGEVHLDSRLKGKKRIEILLHELLHELRQDWVEEEIERVSKYLTDYLWEQGYRRKSEIKKLLPPQSEAPLSE